MPCHVNNFYTNLVKLVWSVAWWGKRWCLDLVPVGPVSGVDGTQVAAIPLSQQMVADFLVFPKHYQYYINSELAWKSLNSLWSRVGQQIDFSQIQSWLWIHFQWEAAWIMDSLIKFSPQVSPSDLMGSKNGWETRSDRKDNWEGISNVELSYQVW